MAARAKRSTPNVPVVGFKAVGLPDDPHPWCAMSGCDKPGLFRDPRPRSALSVVYGCGVFYLCREHLTPVEIEHLRAGAPTAPTPSIIPGGRREQARARKILAAFRGD